jgi:ADP-heptose:LPS heptosyltransferase
MQLHILIIRPGAIGDALLSFPVLKALREHYTGAHITLVSNAQVLPLALAFGVADEVGDYQDIQWSELFSSNGTPALQELLQQIELAICWLRDPGGMVERNLRMNGIRRLIIAPGRPPEGARVHVVEYLAQTAGLSIKRSQWSLPLLSTNPASLEDPARDYVAIHPGSGGPQKCWPVNHFAAVIERLWQQNRPVLLLAGPADTERVRDLINLVATPPRPEMFKTLTNAPLLEVARHLQPCRCYLGNDSGITHLAAMLGVPTVALFGPSDPAVWEPVGPCTKVLYGQLLEQVPVNVVMEAIDAFYELRT